MANKIDSNATGLKFAEETSIKVLPGSPVWHPLEPNGYNDFGGQLSLVARKPINPSRQQQKGVVSDLEASGGFGQDLTQGGAVRLFQGFLFADMREKGTNIPMNGSAIAFSGTTSGTKTYTLASGTLGAALSSGDMVAMSGFTNAANNGIKTVASSTNTTIVVNETVVTEGSPPSDARFQTVGAKGGAGQLDIDVTGSLPKLSRVSGTIDFTTMGLVVGEWVYIGGDAGGSVFTNSVNNGFARIASIATTSLEFDKTDNTMVNETGTGLTINLFFGNVIKNEKTPSLIKRRSYQLERTLGDDANGTMSEYLEGAVANELSIQVRQADKVTMDMGFIATDHTQRDGTTGVKSGSRPALVASDAYNTSSDFSRMRLSIVTAGNANPSALFAYVSELTITVNNNVSPNKAVAVLGAFDVSAGIFQVSGSATAYFADVAAVQAVRNNSDVSLDFSLVKSNKGMVWDVPLLALGDGRLQIEVDQPIKLPLSVEAAEGTAGHTLLFNEFPYLPTVAAG